MNDDISMLKSRLEIMEAVTAQCRKVVEDDGLLYILWGSLAIISSGLNYVVFKLSLPIWMDLVIWGLIFFGVGFMVTVRHLAKVKRNVKTFGEAILIRLWTGAWLVSICIFGLSFIPGIPWQLISFIPFTLSIVYFPLAILLDWKAFYLFAVLWALFGIVMLFISASIAPLILDIAIICCEITPGIMLRLRAYPKNKSKYMETGHE